MKLKMSKLYARVTKGLGILVLNREKKGFQCSMQAMKNIKKSSFGTDVYSVKIDDKIIFVSDDEFRYYQMIEYTIPYADCY